MTQIGAAWLKQKKDKENETEYYYTIALDDAILPLTIDNTKRLVLKSNKNKGDNDKAPNFYLEIYVPDNTKKETPKDPNITKEQKEDNTQKDDKYTDYFSDEL